MTDEVIAIIAWAAGILIAFPTYRWARHKKTKKRKFIEKAQKAGCYVEGEYVDSKVLHGDSYSKDPVMRDESLRVKYKYVVNGIPYYKYLTFQSLGRVGTDCPYSVTVYYDAFNPNKAVCLEETHSKGQIQTGCYTMIVATIVTMFGVYFGIRFLLG